MVERTRLHLLSVRMVFGSALTMAPFVLVVVVELFMGPVFIYFFFKFPNFCVQIYSLGVGFKFGVQV